MLRVIKLGDVHIYVQITEFCIYVRGRGRIQKNAIQVNTVCSAWFKL